MNICIIARGFPTKEYPQWGCFEKDQAEALAAYGHHVVVIYVDSRYKKKRGSMGFYSFRNKNVDYLGYVIVPGVFLLKLLGVKLYAKQVKFRFYEKLYKKVEQMYGKPDIIYSHFFFNSLYGVLLKKKHHIPLVSIEHLGRFNETILPSDSERIALYVFPRVDKLIAVSKKLSSNIQKHFNVDCLVVNNMYGQEFVTTPYFQESTSKAEKFEFVSVARIDYNKGFDILINSFVKAALPKDSWSLNIIGWGDGAANLEELIVKNNLQQNVNLLGKKNKNEIVRELRKSKVFILASRLETFGIVFIEAMSQGLPVIGTICGGPEEVINSTNGMLVPSDDVDAMSEAIKEMFKNYSSYDRKKIAQNCEEKYSPHAIADQLTKIFEGVIENSRLMALK